MNVIRLQLLCQLLIQDKTNLEEPDVLFHQQKKIINGAPHVPVNHKYFKKWHLELSDFES
jgi:hypothetical protein